MAMNLTISMETILNFLHSIPLSTSNKRWLADHLYAEVSEEETKKKSKSDNGWPKIRREDLQVSPEVSDLVKGFEISEDENLDKLKLDYLMKKHG